LIKKERKKKRKKNKEEHPLLEGKGEAYYVRKKKKG